MQLNTRSFDPEVIRRQITQMVLISCGARDFVAGENFLMFRIGQRRGLIEKVIVTLTGLDLYEVRYVAMKRSDYSVIADEETPMVHADQLPRVVRQMGDR